MGLAQQHELVADISDYQGTANMRLYRRAGRRMIIGKVADANDDAGAATYANRVLLAHRVGLRFGHYVIVRFNVGPAATMQHLVERVRPNWYPGDQLMIDVEDYSGHPGDAIPYVRDCQKMLRDLKSPAAFGYTNEAYMAEAGPELANAAWGWIIAAYDGRLLGAGTPKLPRRSKTLLLGKQYTDGQLGAYPRSAPGIGPCDDSILTRHGQHHLLGTVKHLRRPVRHKLLPKPKPACS